MVAEPAPTRCMNYPHLQVYLSYEDRREGRRRNNSSLSHFHIISLSVTHTHASIVLANLVTADVPIMKHCIRPVSYTHLDVYKRQGQYLRLASTCTLVYAYTQLGLIINFMV